MRSFVIAAFVAVTVQSVGCSKNGDSSASTAGSTTATTASIPTASAAASASAVAAEPAVAVPGTPTAYMSITERFGHEAETRPTGVPRVEDVLEAFKKSGAELREVKQHLGSPFGAGYCMGVQTGDDVHMSICEYRSEKAAIAGRESSLNSLKMVPGRIIHRNGGSTLTVRTGNKTPANEELVKKLVKAFESVKPTGTFAPEPPPRPVPSGRIPGSPPAMPAAPKQ